VKRKRTATTTPRASEQERVAMASSRLSLVPPASTPHQGRDVGKAQPRRPTHDQQHLFLQPPFPLPPSHHQHRFRWRHLVATVGAM
jgi:hypothetical protein